MSLDRNDRNGATPGTGATPETGPPPAARRPAPFDACGPLPSGVTLLEASAGTGKTFTIAALAARYVADGTPIERLLLITFTRIATGELRERVRERLLSACDGLTATLAGVAPEADDDILRLLAAGPGDQVVHRRDRLAAALADFDAATIETTHGFCLHVLSGLGVAGDVERNVTLVEDAADLLEEVVDDLYVRRFWSRPDDLRFERTVALAIGRAVLNHPSTVIVPPLSGGRDAHAIRRRFADAAAAELDRRKRLAGVLTYDDVLIRLRDTLADPQRGAVACARLRSRYDVVLIDEFQDTDPVQWEIVRRAFGAGDTTLVLIGDPKQAIYAFRGADVYAYLRAARAADAEATLSVNWRSDQGLIDAYDALFAGGRLGHEEIAYRPVHAAGANRSPRLLGAPVSNPLRVRVVHRDDGLVRRTRHGYVSAAPVRALIAADLAADVVALLSSGAHLVRHAEDSEASPETVRPGHLGVLVRSNAQAAEVQEALHAGGVPAVVAGSGSVFATQPAREWLTLLDALEQPTARTRAAAIALTTFVGWTAVRAATAGDDAWEDLHWQLHRWAAVLRGRGVAALGEHLNAAQQLPARILGRRLSERFLTDLRHVGELLHAEASAQGLGATALTAWLRRRIADALGDAEDEDRSRRLESDAEAVQVLTIHRSKGLEFPIVYCPYLWDGYSPLADIPVFHDPEADDTRTLDVSGEGNDFIRHQQRDLVERRGEDLRLAYVALTRARHQAVVWWAGTSDSQHSPLCRLLLARNDDASIDAFGPRGVTDEQIAQRLVELGARIAVERVGAVVPTRWRAASVPTPDLNVHVFERHLDDRWRRSSYSSITQAAHDQLVTSEPDENVLSDEDVADVPVVVGAGAASGEEGLRDVAVLLGGMPRGAQVGTLVHRLLEAIDFTAVDLAAELRARLQIELAFHLELGDLDAVVAGLQAAIETPLGPLAGELRLRDIVGGDRLNELDFELPLVGGDRSSGELSVADLAATLATHLPPGGPLAGYPHYLADPALEHDLRGYLAGSLDLVVRLPGPRFVVADYKTNWLAGPDEALTAWHYRPAALDAEMLQAHYPLQAVLYTVALHRYLRWRLRGYDPEVHLGGVLYLFLRGMSSPDFPRSAGQPCGVWSWRPPVALIQSLSDLFDRGRT